MLTSPSAILNLWLETQESMTRGTVRVFRATPRGPRPASGCYPKRRTECHEPGRTSTRGRQSSCATEFPQLAQLAEGVEQVGELIAVEPKFPQLAELSKGVEQGGELTVGEPEFPQPAELPEGIGQGGELILVEPEFLQLAKRPESAWQGGELIMGVP